MKVSQVGDSYAIEIEGHKVCPSGWWTKTSIVRYLEYEVNRPLTENELKQLEDLHYYTR